MRSCGILLIWLLLSQPVLGQAPLPAKFWDDLGDLLQDVAPWLTKEAGRQHSERIAKDADIKSVLQWSGRKGYLIHVRAQTDHLSPQSIRLLGDPLLLGVGDTPSDAAIAAASKAAVQQSPSANLTYSTEHSFYVWAELKPRFFLPDKIKYGYLTPEGSSRVALSAVAVIADDYYMKEYTSGRRIKIMRGIVDQLKRESASREAKASAEELLNTYRSRAARLSTLERQLNNDLAAAESAARAAETISMFQNILSLPSLAMQVQAALPGISKKDVKGADNPKELEHVVENYRTDRLENVDRIRPKIEVLSEEEAKAHDAFFESIKLPPHVKRQLVF